MHELLLFASVSARQHHDLLQQLAGLTAMQPNQTFERRLIFKAYRKPGFVKTRPGGSQDVQSSEVQKLNKMLNGGLYYMQVVRGVRAADFGSNTVSRPDVDMKGSDFTEGTHESSSVVPTVGDGCDSANQTWRLEFKDIPEAGARSAVTSRLVGSAKIPYPDVLPVMNAWGYNYVSEYVVEGEVFVLDDTVIFLHRVLKFPDDQRVSTRPRDHLPSLDTMIPLDPSGGYVLQVSITVQESGNPDLLKAASQRLLGLKEHLKPVVKLEPADRLALDTRVK